MSLAKLRVLLLFATALGLSGFIGTAPALCGGASSVAAQISGKLMLGAYKPEAKPSARPSYNWELENGFKEVRADRVDPRRELAVVLLGEGEPSAGLDRVEVTFAGGGLVPSTIAVRAGATVLIRNDDEIAHELLAQGLDVFSAEAISPRGRRSVNLKSAGSWPLRDKIVPHVSGHLYVLPNLVAVAAADAEGQFAFKGLAAGKYVLKVLHGEHELSSQELEVGAQELTLDPITLTVPESK
jgi:hypothetical protein